MSFPRDWGDRSAIENVFACSFQNAGELGSRIVSEQKMDGELFELLKAFGSPERGFPKGLFCRMLYYSAVNLTTLGYGDVVPVTDRGRFLAVLESLIGLLGIGILIWRLTNSQNEANDDVESYLIEIKRVDI